MLRPALKHRAATQRALKRPEAGFEPAWSISAGLEPCAGPARLRQWKSPVYGLGALAVPTNTTPQQIRAQAYLANGAAGGYKVVTLIGVYLRGPYLHDAGVAVGPDALREQGGRFVIANPTQLGTAGTLMRGILPDAAASLRALIDRQLRQAVIAANRAHPDLQRAHVVGIGHEFWVDEAAGFSTQDQTDLILFLLSLDDDPQVLP